MIKAPTSTFWRKQRFRTLAEKVPDLVERLSTGLIVVSHEYENYK